MYNCGGGVLMNIPLSIPNFEGNEEKYVNKAVKEGWVSTGGAYINELEEKMAEFLQTPLVAACQSGTSALHLALVEAGVKAGDYVIVPTLTFIAAVNPVKYQSAEPIFMDCDESFCMNVKKLTNFLEKECVLDGETLKLKADGKRIRALIVVHVFGNMADMETIMKLAQKYHFQVIEDATEALGSYYAEGKYKGRYAGTIGDFGAYSFNGNKIITTGGGGAITSNNPERLKHVKYLSTQAKDDGLYYVHNEIGYNYRMTNLQAALGVAQLEMLPEFIRRKNKNYQLYQKLLQGQGNYKLREFRDNISSNKWFYALEIRTSQSSEELKTIIEALQEQGIQTRPIWGLIHKQKPYKESIAYEITQAEEESIRIINIPCSTSITREEIEYVATKLKEILG